MAAHEWRPCTLCKDTFRGRSWTCEGCRKWAEDVLVIGLFAVALIAFVIVSWGQQ